MLTNAVIQTNHGVSYPVVGPNRIEQAELMSSDEPPLPSDDESSKETDGKSKAVSARQSQKS